MSISPVIVGLLIGLFVGGPNGSFFLGAVGGAFLGFLFSRIALLDQRVRDLEESARTQRPGKAPASTVEPVGEVAVSESSWPIPDTPEGDAVPGFGSFEPESGSNIPEPPTRRFPETGLSGAVAEFAPLFKDMSGRVSSWFSSGNVPVKIGVIITFIGVSFLLKYAIDHQLLRFPIELRLLMIAGGAMAVIMIGWRLRIRRRIYALSLQGGGVGVLFLTIYAAFRVWQLLPPTLAFVMLVVLTVFCGILALMQNSRTLAILGIAGGFLAPILVSMGQGDHVLLFSYYLVLNMAILGIAWFRSWRELNLLGFVFTFVIGSFWGYQYYTPELRVSTQPFLLLHFLFYNVIAVLYSLRQPPERIGIVDGTLVFGTPVIASALQASLMQGTENGLAISAGAVAVFYAMLASWLYRNKGAYLRLLTESFIALAVVFATLTVPLALDAYWTAGTWALEGAALVWIGARQSRPLSKIAGVVLVILGGFAFVDHGWQSNAGIAVVNGNVLGGLIISLSAFFVSRRLHTSETSQYGPATKLAVAVLFLWGAIWWLGTGLMETNDRVARTNEIPVYLVFLTLSTMLADRLGKSLQWKQLRTSAWAFLPFMVLLSLMQLLFDNNFLRSLGWLAWPLAWGVQVYLLRTMGAQKVWLGRGWHMGSLFLLTAMLALESSWWMRQVASTVWAGALATAVWGGMALLVWRCRDRPAWLVPRYPATYFKGSLILVAIQVLTLLIMSLNDAGDPAPLPYIPLLNPFGLAMLFAILTSVRSLAVIRMERQHQTTFFKPYKWMLLAAFFVLATVALVRGVHFYSSVPWSGTALFESVVVQAVLSISWGLLGFGGMIWGAWKKHRLIWLMGAGFMGLVVIKLFLIDLGNTGTVSRIISFMGIGALLLVVGYFAPAPPRHETDGDHDVGEDENG